MPFHRLTTPVYAGGLRGGDDYINNATSGTPAPADNALGAGTYAGSYFFGQGEQATGAGLNRAAKALAQNCDFLDDAIVQLDLDITAVDADLTLAEGRITTLESRVNRDIAAPARNVQAGDGVATNFILTGPVFMGIAGTLNAPGIDGIERIVIVTDTEHNPLIAANGTRIVVNSVSGGTVGSGGFSAGNLTVTLSQAPGNGLNVCFHYFVPAPLGTSAAGFLTALAKFRKGPTRETHRTVTGAAVLNPSNEKIFIDTAGAFTFTLFFPAQCAGLTFEIYDFDGGISNTNRITLARAGSETINGIAADYVLNVPWGRWRLYCDGTNWHISLMHAPYASPEECGHRLTLQSNDPTGSSTSSGTLYFTPHKSNQVSLYDVASARWVRREVDQISFAVTGLTDNTPYDVFLSWDTSTHAAVLTFLAWSNATTRVALGRQNGALVRAGAPAQKYIGSIYYTTGNVLMDSGPHRHVWNYFNQIPRTSLPNTETTNTWTYNTAAWRRANGNGSNNFCDIMIGIAGVVVDYVAYGRSSGDNPGEGLITGIGIDTVTDNNARITTSNIQEVVGTGVPYNSEARYQSGGLVGFHQINWLEYALNNGGDTISGDAGSADILVQTGMVGTISHA